MACQLRQQLCNVYVDSRNEELSQGNGNDLEAIMLGDQKPVITEEKGHVVLQNRRGR